MSKAKKKPQKIFTELSASFPGLVDLVLDDDKNIRYLTFHLTDSLKMKSSEKVRDKLHEPPPPGDIEFPIPRASAVLHHFAHDNDAALMKDIREYLWSVCDLPAPELYDILAIYVLHTYLLEEAEHTPYIYFFAVNDRGKTTAGEAVVSVCYRGMSEESLREANIFRFAEYCGGTIFFDVFDFWRKAEFGNCDDILLCRFKKGKKITRTLFPDRGPFKDTRSFKVFGPTILASNRQVPPVLHGRCITITMKLATRPLAEKSEDKARDLRERCTGFRVRHFIDRLPTVARFCPGRFGDITLPLLQVARLVSPDH